MKVVIPIDFNVYVNYRFHIHILFNLTQFTESIIYEKQ